jgi:hypothetical protein
MGNAAHKFSPDDIAALNGMESTTGMDRKELLKEYKKFKKQFPNGGIDKSSFKEVCPFNLPSPHRLDLSTD